MGFGILFVPLVGGYLFLSRCHWTRFIARRLGGHHLLFWSAAVGMVLLACAWGAELLLGEAVEGLPYVMEQWQRVAPFPYVGTAALAFLLGPFGALLINLFHSESRGAIRTVHRAGNSLELLFVEAMYSDLTVELTLDSGKAYVGWILNAAVAEPDRKFVEMLPLASGYRTQETHKLEFTTNYAPVLAQPHDPAEPVTQHDFRVVIPVAEIRSARPFDFVTYFQFQESGLVD